MTDLTASLHSVLARYRRLLPALRSRAHSLACSAGWARKARRQRWELCAAARDARDDLAWCEHAVAELPSLIEEAEERGGIRSRLSECPARPGGLPASNGWRRG